MLDGIRKAANNWLGRIVLSVIMGVLILSFALWGIGDMLRVSGGTSVATVGKTEISLDQFRNSYNLALEDVSQRLRRRLTNDEAKAFGLDRQVIGRLISESALDQQTRAMGLNLADDQVLKAVMDEPGFKGANGQFDRARFYEALRQSGMNEAGFFADQKRSLLRRQIAAAIGADVQPPHALVEALHRYIAEQRVVSYFVLPPTAVGELALPDEAALKAYYETRKTEFRAPEYRKVNLVTALPRNLGIDLTVTDEDLRRIYERGVAGGQYGTPEKRQVSQILYATEAEASTALDKLKGGASFDDLLAEKKIKPEDADLGMKTRSAFADPAVAAAAFALTEGEVSAPVKTGFGAALVRLTKIEPGALTPFESVRQTLQPIAYQEKLRSDPRISARLDDISKKIEDARVAGKSLAEAAPLAGLTMTTLAALDNTGKDKAGQKLDLPGGDETLKAIYQSDIGLDNEPLRPRDGGFVWFEIAGVESPRERGYDEVKADLLARWKGEETTKKLSAMGADLVKKLDDGADIAELAKAAGVEAQTVTINRNAGGAIGANGAAQAYAVAIGKAASASLDAGGRAILKVSESKLAPLDPASGVALQIRKELSNQLGEDVLTQYVQRVQTVLGASINQRMLQMALGGGSGN